MADFLCLFCSCNLAGSDRPDRLISNDHRSSLLLRDTHEIALELQTDPVDRNPHLTLLKCLAAAEDRDQTILKCLEYFSVQESVILFVILSSFRVTDDDILDTCINKHRTGDFTGESAAVLVGEVLCANSHIGALYSLCHGNDVNGRHAINDVHIVILYKRSQKLDKSFCLRGGLVHFPVTGYDFPSCHVFSPNHK